MMLKLTLVGMCAVSVIGIVAYNASLKVRHQFSALRDRVEELGITNADLKNQLYSLTDSKTLSSVATRIGLVPERNPQYLNVRLGIIVAQN